VIGDWYVNAAEQRDTGHAAHHAEIATALIAGLLCLAAIVLLFVYSVFTVLVNDMLCTVGLGRFCQMNRPRCCPYTQIAGEQKEQHHSAADGVSVFVQESRHKFSIAQVW
jgi:hypothetical protein